jgi:hypothetical protein
MLMWRLWLLKRRCFVKIGLFIKAVGCCEVGEYTYLLEESYYL